MRGVAKWDACVQVPILDQDALLCSDKKPAYKAFAKKNNFELKTINVSAKEHVNHGIYHVQNVNAYDSRLKEWRVCPLGYETFSRCSNEVFRELSWMDASA